jgi:hypothetical protein
MDPQYRAKPEAAALNSPFVVNERQWQAARLQNLWLRHQNRMKKLERRASQATSMKEIVKDLHLLPLTEWEKCRFDRMALSFELRSWGLPRLSGQSY